MVGAWLDENYIKKTLVTNIVLHVKPLHIVPIHASIERYVSFLDDWETLQQRYNF